MNKYLITGRAGSGKSTVWEEMQRRGVESLDGDKVPGLSRWEDPKTGEPVKVNALELTNTTTANWNWNPDLMQEILQRPGKLFFCGSSDNQFRFHPFFDKVFVLTVSPETQRQRLTDRNHNYGKDPWLQTEIIKEQIEFTKQAIQLGALAVDSERPIRAVVDEILAKTNAG